MQPNLTPHPVPGPHGVPDLRGREAVSHVATAGELLASALWHASTFGWRVGPCEIGGKAPAVPHGFKSFSADRNTILNWWEGPCPGANPAVATGYPGPDVLDIDVRPDGNGWEAFHRLREAGLLAGAHRMVRTRSGGLHIYFAGTGQRCGSIRGLHVDFKASGGYVLLPPSFVDAAHTDDGIAGSYQVVEERRPTGRSLDWETARRLLRPPKPVTVRGSFRRRPGSVKHLPGWITSQGVGNRNKALYWAACRAAEAGNEQVLLDLVDAGAAAGLDRAEAYRTVVSAARKVNGDVR